MKFRAKPDLAAWSEQRPPRTAQERHEIADAYSRHLPPLPRGLVWSDEDFDAMKAEFIAPFDEDLPRTETLLAVAAIGYRIAMKDKS